MIMNFIPKMNRRSFVVGAAAVGGGLSIGFELPTGPQVVRAADGAPEIGVWVVIRPDETVVIRTALAHVILRGADAATAAGTEIAPRILAGDALAGRRILGRDLRPIAFQFFGDHLGEAGERALPHLGAGNTDDDGVIRLDDDPGVDLGRALRAGRGQEGNVKAEGQTGGGRADDERTAIYFGREIHGAVLPQAFAAAWIAARTCWKVPHRQILVIASLISASVGFGFSFSSADTAMIMPL